MIANAVHHSTTNINSKKKKITKPWFKFYKILIWNRPTPIELECDCALYVSMFLFLQVDASLSFLDGFVAEALSKGAAPYKPPHQRQEEKLSREKGIHKVNIICD